MIQALTFGAYFSVVGSAKKPPPRTRGTGERAYPAYVGCCFPAVGFFMAENRWYTPVI